MSCDDRSGKDQKLKSQNVFSQEAADTTLCFENFLLWKDNHWIETSRNVVPTIDEPCTKPAGQGTVLVLAQPLK